MNRFPIDLKLIRVGKIAQRFQNAIAVDRLLAETGAEVSLERGEVGLHLPVRRHGRDLVDDGEARHTRQGHDVAPVAGLGELRDTSGTADFEQGWNLARLPLRIGLNDPDETMPLQRIVDQREVARLEDVERQLSARQQKRAGQRKQRHDSWHVAYARGFFVAHRVSCLLCRDTARPLRK